MSFHFVKVSPMPPEPRSKHSVPGLDFSAVRECLPPYFVDIVCLLRLTGMRPSELCSMRVEDIDRSKDIWVYIPERH